MPESAQEAVAAFRLGRCHGFFFSHPPRAAVAFNGAPFRNYVGVRHPVRVCLSREALDEKTPRVP